MSSKFRAIARSRAFSIVYETFHGFFQHKGLQNSAMIAYFASLSLIPFFMLLVAATGVVFHLLGPHYGSETELLGLIQRALQDFSPRIMKQVMPRLKDIIYARSTIGIVGFVFLFFSAGLVFEALESSLRSVFNPDKKRHFLFSRILFFLFFAGLGFLLVVLYFLMVISKPWLHVFGQASILKMFSSYRVLDFGVSLLLLAGGFIVLVSHFSFTRMKAKALIGGGTLFFLLFETARTVFSYYIEHFARFDWVYGSLATVMIGAIWIYYSAVIFLFCTEFTRVLHEMK